MIDSITSFFSLESQLVLMFLSAFLSATILPGNSEILFGTLIYQAMSEANGSISLQMLLLFASAVIGNSLGGISTYLLALLIPAPDPKRLQSPTAQWALRYSQKYGAWTLLFSWLPIIGDLFCAIAGWLRFGLWQSICLITLGKSLRYLILFWGIYFL